MSFEIIKADITKMKTEAIVNAANKELQMGGGVSGAIFKAAGAKELQKECNSIDNPEVGGAVITGGYKLDAKKIIHAVGPIWSGGEEGEEELLYSAYKSSLELALENGISSIAFPLISAGIYGYPKNEAIEIAISAVKDFLEGEDMEVYLVLHGEETYKLGKKIFSKKIKKHK